MRWERLDDAKVALDEALNGRLCVQAWIGYACVLFIGFGEEVLPPVPPGERHPIPTYELRINFADWWVENDCGVIGTSNDERSNVLDIAELFVGHRVVSWQFVDQTIALEIHFDGGLKLKMKPYSEYEDSNESAWVLRMPGQYYGFARWDGIVGTGCSYHTPNCNAHECEFSSFSKSRGAK